jgi:AAA domain/UvrD-like helicase C-terminal domain
MHDVSEYPPSGQPRTYFEIEKAITELGFNPSVQQFNALYMLWDFVTEGRKFRQKWFGLYGFAGTGKTSVIQILVKALQHSSRTRIFNTAQCAPTNKAVKVLAQKGRAVGNGGCRYETVHKLLGLTREITEEGEIVYVPKSSTDPNKKYLADYDLVIVDEVSMIGDDLWEQIQAAGQNRDGSFTQFVMMGDPAQLPPISKGTSGDAQQDPLFEGEFIAAEIKRESPIFTAIPDSLTLSEVMRYDGQLTILAKQIRDDLDAEALPPIADFLGDQIQAEDDFGWIETLIKLFRQQKAEGLAPDYAKAIAYTNRCVDDINKKVRLAVLGESAKEVPYLSGDRLVLKTPLQKMGSVVLPARSEVLVTRAELYDPVASGYEPDPDDDPALAFKNWRITCIDEERIPRSLQILAAEEAEAYKKRARRLQALAKTTTKDKKAAWRAYYEFLERFIEVQYAFAMTCHSAQGSTFEHAYVHMGDLLKNKNLRERNQLFYTAITRASKRLVLAI